MYSLGMISGVIEVMAGSVFSRKKVDLEEENVLFDLELERLGGLSLLGRGGRRETLRGLGGDLYTIGTLDADDMRGAL